MEYLPQKFPCSSWAVLSPAHQWASKRFISYSASAASVSLPCVTSCSYHGKYWRFNLLLQNSCIFLYPGLESVCWSEHPLCTWKSCCREVLTPFLCMMCHTYSLLQDLKLLLHPRCFPLDVSVCWSYWPVGLDLTCRAHLFLLKQIEGRDAKDSKSN